MTSERYHKEVSEIAQLDPTNIFLPSLRAAHTAATEAYLSAAWKIVNSREAAKTNGSTGPVVSKPANPEAVNDLFRKKGHINREMRRIKATGLTIETPLQDRRRLMQQLDGMQAEWAVIQRQIRVWELTKELPTAAIVAHNAEATLQERIADLDTLSDLELSARLNTARACHSRKKSAIEKTDPSVMDPLHPKHKAWQRAETALVEYEHLETEINRRKEAAKQKNG